MTVQYILGLVFVAAITGLAPSALAAPFYADKAELMVYRDESGASHPVKIFADWDIRRAHILANVREVMGPFPDASKRVPLDIQVEGEEDFPGYTRKRISYATEPGDRVPAYLLVPKGVKGKAPAMLCLHPTSKLGKKQVVGLGDRENRNYAEELALRGYVCIVPDYPRMGDYDIDFSTMGYESCTMKAIWNHLRGVDVLQSLPEVDGNRIGAIGHSLGGHNTLFAGLFDDRVKVFVTSCGFNAFTKYEDGDLTGWSSHHYMPRIGTVYGNDGARMPFDFHEVLGVLAPRPVFVNAPLKDHNFLTGVQECVDAAKPVYALYGAAPPTIVRPDCEHDFPPEIREQAYAFIDAALK
jgi:Glucuronyl esterase, fungi